MGYARDKPFKFLPHQGRHRGAKERYAAVGLNDHAITWEDAVAEYKGVLSGILDKNNKHPDPKGKMQKFRSLYEKFQE